MEKLSAIILAAGAGTRMKSDKPKVLHEACGKPLVEWVCDAVYGAGVEDCITVVGHKAKMVRDYLGDKVQFALQEQQLGTGHAVMQAKHLLQDKQGHVVILNGDAPLVQSDTIQKALQSHIAEKNAVTVLTAELSDSTGYGRIVRNEAGHVTQIIEQKDATIKQRDIKEVNSGIYCFNISNLLVALAKLSNENAQGEYYLTDTIEILIKDKHNVGAVKIENASELLGVNDRKQLWHVQQLLNQNIIHKHMDNGVTFIDPNNTYIDGDVEIKSDTVIYPGCILQKATKIGHNCIIGPNSQIIGCTIEENVEIKHSVLLDSYVSAHTKVGPFAYLRPGSHIGKNVKIGDFVEVKNAKVGDNTKISHLSYVGDAELGKNVNMGCGTVVVNYDGKQKHKTTIHDNAFVGCNVNLVSPVIVNENAFIAAGSTITEEVPKDALAIARERQTIKKDWVKKRSGQDDTV